MTMLPISADLKLQRAQVHLDALARDIRAFADSKPYSVNIETNVERGEHIITTVVQDTPLSFGTIAGDFIHCLRGALDHIAWLLAARRVVRPAKPSERVSFPIYGVYDAGTPRSIARDTEGIDPAAIAIMESLQPYHHGSHYKLTHLWRLNKLWNIDKHRHLAFHSSILHARFPSIPEFAKAFIILEANDYGHVMRVPISVVGDNVNLRPTTGPIQVRFGDEEEGICLTVDDFGLMYKFVKDSILPRFNSFLI